MTTKNIRTKEEWDERYRTGNTPWLAHGLLESVVSLIRNHLKVGSSILEIGCGYAEEAIALAKLGYKITATDISIEAINQAKAHALKENVQIKFLQTDIINDITHLSQFPLVFDISVLHTFPTQELQRIFSEHVFELLPSDGLWVNVSCIYSELEDIAEKTGVQAPPGLTDQEIQTATKGLFTIIEQQRTHYTICREDKKASFPARLLLMKKL